MIDEPKIFGNLGKNPNFKEPLKKINEFSGVESFQKSVALKNLNKIINRILYLTHGLECPAGLLSPETVTRVETAHKLEKVENLEDAESVAKSTANAKSRPAPPKFNESEDPLDKLRDNEPVLSLMEFLQRLNRLIDETPPQSGPRRYGNPSYKLWHHKMKKEVDAFLKEISEKYYNGPNKENFKKEIKFYISNAFGEYMRLDYGTGHELDFVAFLGALWMSDVLQNMDGIKFLAIFCKYYDLVRKLILRYSLEPAGSHGVWGLDDHFHFSYLLGVSQFVDINYLGGDHEIEVLKSRSANIPQPASIMNKDVMESQKLKNLYYNSIAFIMKVKLGPFWETSPMLYDISGVKSWQKIFLGLKKMYNVEVLHKFPVIQHFYFGGVFYPWIDSETSAPLPVAFENSKDDDADSKSPKNANDIIATKFPAHKLGPISNSRNITTAAPWATNHHSNTTNHHKQMR